MPRTGAVRTRAGGGRRYTDQVQLKRNFIKAKLEKALVESDEVVASTGSMRPRARRGRHRRRRGLEHIQEKIAAIQGRRERFEEHRCDGEGQLERTETRLATRTLTDPVVRRDPGRCRLTWTPSTKIAERRSITISDLGLLAGRRWRPVGTWPRSDRPVADRATRSRISSPASMRSCRMCPTQRGSTVSQGLFPKERFRYDGGEDIYICPDGRLAYSKRKRRDLFFASYANRAACKECQSSRSVRKATSVGSCAMSTKRSWSAWQNDWQPARSCSMRDVKASSIPSAQSNNGWARVPS